MPVQLASRPSELDPDADDDLDEMARLLGRVLGVGTLVAERYRLEAIVGRGGAATVWRARDVVLDRWVAVKILLPRPGRDLREAQVRFLREARLCAAVRHPNVVGVTDCGVHEERPFVAMDMLEGEALDTRLGREVQLEPSETVAVLLGILDGLHAAHVAGVIHRDLKPANVFLTSDGDRARPTLLDFGVSRSLDRAVRPSAVTTVDGQLIGTPEYMSPEQARGSADIDHRSDLYSAGVILYECLAGVLPYESDNVGELIVEIVTREPLSLGRVRPDLTPFEPVLGRALAHHPDARFASAREMRAALLEAYAGFTAGGPEARPLEVRPYRARARRARPRPARPWDTPMPRRDSTTEPRQVALGASPPPLPPRAPAIPPPLPPRASARRHRRRHVPERGSLLVGLLLMGAGLALGAWAATREPPPPPVVSQIVSRGLAIDAPREADSGADADRGSGAGPTSDSDPASGRAARGSDRRP